VAARRVIGHGAPVHRATRTFVKKNWFLAGMASAVALATVAPSVGRTGGPIRADVVTTAGVFAIFFLHGMGLSPATLRAGAGRWKLHLFIQAFTFLAFPLVAVVVRATVGWLLPRDLLLGFVFLCTLPSTITSSVAMTAIARGNVAAALFDASLSSLLGVFLTPLLVAALAGSTGAFPLGPAITNVGKLIVAPLLLGQLLRPALGDAFARHRHATHLVDRFVVLGIVYVSFCDSVAAGLWGRFGVGALVLTAAFVAALLVLVLVLTWRGARVLGFPREDEKAAVFCGSVKALAIGLPMARALFPGDPALGAIVLPIMLYHPLQILACSLIAERYAQAS
jgi:sodium/bile acid cotransporter 7